MQRLLASRTYALLLALVFAGCGGATRPKTDAGELQDSAPPADAGPDTTPAGDGGPDASALDTGPDLAIAQPDAGSDATPPPINMTNVLVLHTSSGDLWMHSSGDNMGVDTVAGLLLDKAHVHDVRSINYWTTIAPDPGRPQSLGMNPGNSQYISDWFLWFNDHVQGLKTLGCGRYLNRVMVIASDYRNNWIAADTADPPNPFGPDKTVANYKAVFRHPDGPGKTYRDANQVVYRPLEDVFADNPDTLFIYVTQPPPHYAPANKVTIRDDEALRARELNDWIKGEWLDSYRARHPELNNVGVFDWFDALAYPAGDPTHPNRLREKYGGARGDSHPTTPGTQATALMFAGNQPNLFDTLEAAYPWPRSAITPPGDGPRWTTITPPQWKTIEPGDFLMGTPTSDPCAPRSFPETQHSVTLTHRFDISTTETTQGQFAQLMGYNPSHQRDCGETCPVETVTWPDAMRYCNALSRAAGLEECYDCQPIYSGQTAYYYCRNHPQFGTEYQLENAPIYNCRGYRLPTEAEWEYAYRAGTTTAFYGGAGPTTQEACFEPNANLDRIGWYGANADQTTHPAGGKDPNAWGLYDMAGNVSEYVHDGSYGNLGTAPRTDPAGIQNTFSNILRGGSAYDTADGSRATTRTWMALGNRCNQCGFRCARTLP